MARQHIDTYRSAAGSAFAMIFKSDDDWFYIDAIAEDAHARSGLAVDEDGARDMANNWIERRALERSK